MDISTKQLEELFYQGEEGLKKASEALQKEFERVEYGEGLLRNYIADNANEADKLMQETLGLYGILSRALEFADSALDHYENLALEEIRIAAEQKGDKKPTDTVLKTQAAIKVSSYRRVRGLIRGYVSSLEKSSAGLRSSIDRGNAETYTAKRQSYQETEQQG